MSDECDPRDKRERRRHKAHRSVSPVIKERRKRYSSRSPIRRSPSRRERPDHREPSNRHRQHHSPRRRSSECEHGDKGRHDAHRRRYSLDRTRRERRRSHSKDKEEDHVLLDKAAPVASGDEDTKDDDGPNFKTSGKLAAETNTYKGVVIVYSEPPEARVPKTRWRLYPFKGEEQLHVLYVHRQSAYLIGRDRKVVDMPIDHPSCSKQHAALQYRLVQIELEDGKSIKKTKPYIIDLNSTNGTYLNNQRIDPRRYYELKEKDVLKFGFSSRDYVLLTESAAGVDSPPSDNKTA